MIAKEENSAQIGAGEHTPGPWKVEPDLEFAGGHPLHQNRFITSGEFGMCDDEWAHEDSCRIIAKMTDCQQQVANARLIAAAPELSDALRRILTLAQKPHDEWTFEAIESIARAAIAKATGGAQ